MSIDSRNKLALLVLAVLENGIAGQMRGGDPPLPHQLESSQLPDNLGNDSPIGRTSCTCGVYRRLASRSSDGWDRVGTLRGGGVTGSFHNGGRQHAPACRSSWCTWSLEAGGRSVGSVFEGASTRFRTTSVSVIVGEVWAPIL